MSRIVSQQTKFKPFSEMKVFYKDWHKDMVTCPSIELWQEIAINGQIHKCNNGFCLQDLKDIIREEGEYDAQVTAYHPQIMECFLFMIVITIQ